MKKPTPPLRLLMINYDYLRLLPFYLIFAGMSRRITFGVTACGAAHKLVPPAALRHPLPCERHRHHIEALVKALNSGSSDEWEKMAQEHFSPGELKRQSVQERKQAFDNLRHDFGTISLGRGHSAQQSRSAGWRGCWKVIDTSAISVRRKGIACVL
jgi:hypothetical protein